MSAIGKGDWVECVDGGPLRNGAPSGLRTGAVYQVERIGRVSGRWKNAGKPEVVLVEVKHPLDGAGFDPERFRPIYRRNQQLIESLKQPAPAGVRELEDA
jgi:hypothetical protein